jgi:hypothetical protein
MRAGVQQRVDLLPDAKEADAPAPGLYEVATVGGELVDGGDPMLSHGCAPSR